MEILSVPSAFTVLVITLITILLSKIFLTIRRQYTYWKNKNVPHIKFFMGWKFFARRMTFFEYSNLMYNQCPNAKYIGLMDFEQPNIILRDPELIREVTVKSFDHFMDHKGFLDETIEPIFSKNIFSLRGEQWKEMRNILTPSFTASKMRFMFELISKCAQEFVDYLYDHPEYTSSMDVKDAFSRYTSDVIASVAFGVSVNSIKDRDNEFFLKGRDVFANILNNMYKLILMRLFPRLMKVLGIKIIPPNTTNFFRRVISETLKEREEQGIVRPDMLHLLIQAKGKDKPTAHQMTIDDIISQAFIFFSAGSESTSSFMCFMTYDLALNPDVQERLREEVDRCLDEGNGELSYETLMKMEYMEMVMSETLRMHPALVLVDRVCTKKYEFPPAEDGYNSATLYPGETLWIPAYSLHYDPKYFPDPEKYDPERFSNENKDKIVPYTYLPFGAGPRKCIGDRFVFMETKILMARLLHRFVLKRTEKTKVPLVFQKGSVSVNPVDPFWIGFERRVV